MNLKQIIAFFFILCSFTAILSSQSSSLIPTRVQEISAGLVWKQIQTDGLFNSRQNINILEVSKGYTFKLAYSADSLIRTSDFAKAAEALAAVNGGFFDMENGGSVTFMKVNGRQIHETLDRFTESENEILESALIITSKGSLQIRPSYGMDQWKNKERYASILVTGPLLLFSKKAMPLVDRSFTNKRHPRTSICTTNDRKTLLITVDGRHEEAQGMSLQELTRLTQLLNCRNAINLDGGGSTTMYIKGKSDNGVVNKPSDNKKFDHKGERACANSILIVKEFP